MEHRAPYIDLEPGTDPPPGFDVVELKFDGHWAEARFDGRGICEIYTRTGTLRKRCEVDRRLPRMTLIGEYLYGTHWSTWGNRSRQFHVFDIVPSRWRRPTLAKRRRTFARVFNKQRAPEWFHRVEQAPADGWRGLWDSYVETGIFEGLVFKKSTGLFGEPHTRMKRIETADFVCMGFAPGLPGGKYEGVVGSVVCGLYRYGVLGEVANVAGLTDVQRKAFAANPDSFIGRVFEATGKGRFESGALRHGTFLRWRDDKRPEECTWDSV